MITIKEALLLPALGLAFAVVGKCAQAAPAETAQDALEAKPLCDPAWIDGTVTFGSLPVGEQTVSLHFQNKSNTTCRLHGQAGPSFGVDGHSMYVANCWLCDQNNIPSRFVDAPGSQIILAPGERATLDLHWASTGASCQWADDVDFFFMQWQKPTGYLFVPSNWPMHICSSVKSAGYHAEPDSPSVGGMRDSPLRVSVTPKVIYSDERATLHVELAAQPATVVSSAGCASLYSVRQGPSIGTRFEPLPTTSFSSRPSYTPEQIREDKERAWPSWRKDRLRRCDILGRETNADAHLSAADLANLTHIEWHAVSEPDEHPIFLTATTHFNVLDVDTLPPNWGDPVEGIRAGLSIDRVSFKLGEPVPLRLRWENVNAAVPLAQGECMEPEPTLEIQDSQHNVVKTIPMFSMCMSHGWGPFTIPKGKPQRTFIELATAHSAGQYAISDVRGELPGPGVYYLASVWSPLVLDPPDAEAGIAPRIGSSGRFGKVYATARSQPVRVEVAPGNNP